MSTSNSAENYILGAPTEAELPTVRSEVVADKAAVSARALPSFVIVGPPRTGTSWLHEILGKRAILPDLVKETRFFDAHFQRGLDWYRAHYRKSEDGEVVGEVAPTYFACTAARERLLRTIPEARIVCIFRDPVERIFSHYRIKRAYGMIPWNFEEAMVRDPELMESNRYGTYFKEWLRVFGPEQVVATLYDDLRDRPQGYVDSVADFAGMPRFALTAAETRKVHSSKKMTLPRSYPLTRSATLTAEWCKARRLHSVVRLVKSSPLRKLLLGGGLPFEQMPTGLALRLYEKFTPEVEELEALLNRDLSAWKSPDSTRRFRLGEVA